MGDSYWISQARKYFEIFCISSDDGWFFYKPNIYTIFPLLMRMCSSEFVVATISSIHGGDLLLQNCEISRLFFEVFIIETISY